jgi:hypothetical protein
MGWTIAESAVLCVLSAECVTSYSVVASMCAPIPPAETWRALVGLSSGEYAYVLCYQRDYALRPGWEWVFWLKYPIEPLAPWYRWYRWVIPYYATRLHLSWQCAVMDARHATWQSLANAMLSPLYRSLCEVSIALDCYTCPEHRHALTGAYHRA